VSQSVKIYIDGACKGNPGPGDWGALLCYGDIEKELYGGELGATNNQMELMGAIKALEALSRPCKIILTTGSEYVRKGILEWVPGWKKRDWMTAAKKPVKNKALWLRLDQAQSKHEIKWKWVKGHSGHPGNERADDLANRGAARAQK
jgi:ribonuclease HI